MIIRSIAERTANGKGSRLPRARQRSGELPTASVGSFRTLKMRLALKAAVFGVCAALVGSSSIAAEQRLASNGYIFWDRSGIVGDIVIVRLLPQQDDEEITVALYGELKQQGHANWFPLKVSKLGHYHGYTSHSAAGTVHCHAVVQPQGVEPIDIPLQIPAYACDVPTGQFTLRYKVRTIVRRRGAAPVWVDSKVTSATAEISKRPHSHIVVRPGQPTLTIRDQHGQWARAPRDAGRVNQAPQEPFVKKFTFVD